MSSEAPQGVAIRYVKPEDVVQDRLEAIISATEGSVVIGLHDAHVEEGQEDTLLAAVDKLLEMTRAAAEKVGAQERVQIIPAVHRYRGGHNKIIRTRTLDGSDGSYCMRRNVAGVPRPNETALRRYNRISPDVDGLLDQLGITDDPRTTNEDSRVVRAHPWIDGERLNEIMFEDGISLEEMYQIWMDVLTAVEALHEGGVVHSDVLPKNILRTPDGAKLIDPDLAEVSRPVGEGDPKGTKDFPPELQPSADYAHQQRVIQPRTDMYRTRILFRSALLLRGRGLEALPAGASTDFQMGLFRLGHACQAKYPALRPTASEMKQCLEILWRDLNQAHGLEAEETRFSVTKEANRAKGFGKQESEPDPFEILRHYEQLGDVQGSDPVFLTDLALRNLDCGEAALVAEDQDLARTHLERATELYLQYLERDPLNSDPRRVTRRLQRLHDHLAALDGDDVDHHAESQAWGLMTAVYATDLEDHRAVRALNFEQRGQQSSVDAMLEAVNGGLSERLDSGNAWGRDEITPSLDGDPIEWWRGLPREERIRLNALMHHQMSNMLRIAVENGGYGVTASDACRQALLYSDLILAVNETPSADFWAGRGEIFNQMGGSENNFQAQAEGAFNIAYAQAPTSEWVVAQSADFVHKNLDDPTRAREMMGGVAPIARTPEFCLEFADHYELGSSERADLLQEGYLRDPSSQPINEVIVLDALRTKPPDFSRAAHHIEKVFCHDPARASHLLEQEFIDLFDSGMPQLNRDDTIQLYAIWSAWDQGNACHAVMFRLANEQEDDGWDILRDRAAAMMSPITRAPGVAGVEMGRWHEFEQQRTLREAANVLVTGALPSQLDVVSARVVQFGPTENQDEVLAAIGEDSGTELRSTDAMVPSEEDGIQRFAFPIVVTETSGDTSGPPSIQREIGAIEVRVRAVPAEFNLNDMLVRHSASLLGKKHADERYVKAETTRSMFAAERDHAGKIQESLAPSEYPEVEGYEILGRVDQGDTIVGGDGIVCEQIDENRIFFAVYDVAGHDVPTGIVQATLNGYIRGEVRTHKRFEAILQKVPRLFKAPVRKLMNIFGNKTMNVGDTTRGANQLLCDLELADKFATAVFGVFDRSNNTIQMFNAGHGSTHIARSKEDITSFASAGLPLGVVNDDDPDKPIFDESGVETIQLQPGNTFVIYTDGFSESGVEDGTDNLLSEKGMVAIIKANHGESAETLIDQAFEASSAKGALDNRAILVIQNTQAT